VLFVLARVDAALPPFLSGASLSFSVFFGLAPVDAASGASLSFSVLFVLARGDAVSGASLSFSVLFGLAPVDAVSGASLSFSVLFLLARVDAASGASLSDRAGSSRKPSGRCGISKTTGLLDRGSNPKSSVELDYDRCMFVR